MDMFLLTIISLFLGYVLYQLLYNPYLHLVLGSIMSDVKDKLSNAKKTIKKRINKNSKA